METLDIILGITLGYGLIRGIWKGLIIEIASLVAVLLGIYGAIHFSFYVADFLTTNSNWNGQTIKIISFVITLIIIMLLIMLLGKLFTKIADMVAMGLFNRLLGGVFGFLKMAIISGALLMYMDKTEVTKNWISEQVAKNSVLYTPVKSIATFVYANIFKEKEEEITTPSERNITLPPGIFFKKIQLNLYNIYYQRVTFFQSL